VLTVLSISGMLTVGWLVALAIFLGCVSAVEVPTRQAFVSSLVGESELLNAIGLNSAIFNTSRLLGPVLAGVVLGMFGENVCFIANAVSYIAALATLQMLSMPDAGTKPKDSKSSKGASEAVFKMLLRDATVRGILLLTFATALFGFPYAVLLPVITKDILHGNASTLAFISAAAAVGGLIGSLGLARVKNRTVISRLMGTCVLALSVAIALLGYSTYLPASVFCTFCAGLLMAVQFSGGNSLLQTSIAPDVRGRIMAVYTWCLLGSAPLAALTAGWLAEHLGVPAALAINGGLLAVAAVLFLTRVPKLSEPTK
jgi:MFS family permease